MSLRVRSRYLVAGVVIGASPGIGLNIVLALSLISAAEVLGLAQWPSSGEALYLRPSDVSVSVVIPMTWPPSCFDMTTQVRESAAESNVIVYQ